MRAERRTRLQLDLTDRQMEALKRLAGRLDAQSHVEVFRRSLILMERIMSREEEKGLQFGFVDPQTNLFTEVWTI